MVLARWLAQQLADRLRPVQGHRGCLPGPLTIAHGTWLGRDDFASFIHHGTGTAAIDWEAAITALDAGLLPSSAGEKRMLRLAASLADQAHVSLGDAITGIDEHNVDLLIKSVRHASGRRQF
jgi:hypothetical protein